MQVKHNKTLIPSQGGFARIHAICWSPNNKRLAIADNSRYINIYDELGERRERFSARAADGKGKAFVIRGMAFSPDNTKLAIAQSDNVVLVCRLGIEWGEKKSYSNNFQQKVAVTCVMWPTTSQGTDFVIFGMQDGSVRVGLIKTNKSQTLYPYEHTVVSLTVSLDGSTIYSGHTDGAILQYVLEGDDGPASGAKRLVQHSCPPYVLSAGENLCAAGHDCIVTFYDKIGQRLQQFDYPVAEEKDYAVGSCNPSGQAVAIAAFNKIRLFNFNLRARKWEEGVTVPLPNAYCITTLAWKSDGGRLITGTLAGAVDEFDTCLKRYRIRNAFEFTYVSHSQVIVKRLATGTRIVLRSNQGFEIQRVNVYKEKYLVAHTSTSLMVGDLVSCKLSEVPWQFSGKEKFVFDNPQVCMVFAVGELCLIEYGKNEVLGTCRTEASNMHRISVRIHEPPAEPTDGSLASMQPARKCIAYFIDRLTIQVNDLLSGTTLARISHPCKVDWLELNHRANRLLYRDKEHQLYIFNLATQQRTTLLNYCSYVQWVPNSDVAVAQNRGDLCVWYNIDSPDLVTVVPIKGEVEGIERGNGKTEVIVDEGVNTVGYALDEALIEFGTAMEDRDYDRACDLLDKIPLAPETTAMWQNLSTVALQELKLLTAERCFAALGDVAKVRALRRINELAGEAAKMSDGMTNGYDHYTAQAELSMLSRDFQRAEQIFLENGKEEAAMAMWEEMNGFDRSIAIAEMKGHPDLANKRARFYNWLMETGQYEKAGEIREKEGKYIDAINLYLRGGTPARAANVVSLHGLKPEQQLLEAIAAALFKSQVFEKAGDFFEKLRMDDRALDAYRRGHVYNRAIEFVKRAHPDKVVALEEEWGDYLVSQKQVDQAINHYMEAHQYHKAITAAINSRQWTKAVGILESQNVSGVESDEKVKGFYKQIARHYQESSQHSEAEKHYLKAGAVNEAVEMYNRAGMQDQMYRVAQRYLSPDKLIELFVGQAESLASKGDYSGAERIYLKVDQPDRAIGMYKKGRDFTNMIRLVQAYRPEFLLKAHLSLAIQFEKENNLKLAETHYVAGKDWGRAVNMYRDREMWDDAVRVAKVHGGVNAAKQVVLARAMAVQADEGVRLLVKFSLVEAGIDAAVSAQKFDVALQWAQLAQPAKQPFVYLKYAMHYEDQGDFRMAEDAFIKSGKPREAIDMYVHQQDYASAMRVAEAHDQSAISSICVSNGRVSFQRGNYQEAEALLLRANAPETLLKLYMDARMFSEAQRVAKEHSPDMLGEIAKRIALQSNDPRKAGVVLEENGEYQLAIDTYLGATNESVPDELARVNLWVRAVKVAQNHSRNTLKDVLRAATGKLKEAQRFIEAGKCYEDCEDYKGAINMYVQGKKFDLAENLAKRVSPELEDYVRRAIVQSSIESGGVKDARAIEDMDPDAALKAYISNNDWENAMRLVKRKPRDEQLYTAGLEVQYYVREGKLEMALAAITRSDFDPDDFRFFATWLQLAEKLPSRLPSEDIDLATFHDLLVKVVSSMDRSGQKIEDVQKGKALVHIIHAYHMAPIMKENGLDMFALQLMLGLPRWVPYIPADKAYFDAGLAAKEAGEESIGFVYLNRFLDITERIEEGDENSANINPGEFALTDFPQQYPLTRKVTVSAEAAEEVNKWVLALSIKSDLNAHLPTVEDPKANETMMFEGSLKSPTGTVFEECAVTGYPILGGAMARCQSCQRPAKQESWNRFVMQMKMCPWCKVERSPDFKM